MADRHRGVARSSSKRHGLPDDLAAADDHGVAAGQGDLLPRQQLDHAGGRAGREGRPALDQQAHIVRMKAVHVLRGIDRVEDLLRLALAAPTAGSGACTRIPSHARIPVELLDQRQHRVGRDVGRQAMDGDAQAGLTARLLLVAHVDVRGRIVAGQHDGQGGRPAARRRESRRRAARARRGWRQRRRCRRDVGQTLRNYRLADFLNSLWRTPYPK